MLFVRVSSLDHVFWVALEIQIATSVSACFLNIWILRDLELKIAVGQANRKIRTSMQRLKKIYTR